MEGKKLVEQAKAWLGKKESDGSFREIIDLYNSHTPLARGYKVKYTDSWCAAFVSAAAIACGCTELIPTECSCGRMIELLQKKGIWEENDAYIPKAGDILFYDWQDSGKGDNTGWPDHVGIVESVENGHITVIEGNLNNAVGRREIAVNARYIRGYGVPRYEEEQPEADTETPQKSLDEVAKEVINGKYGNGAERKRRIPEETPYSYEEVQARVNAILSGKEPAESVPAVEYYPQYTGNTNSIVDALKAVKVDSSYAHRKEIAGANGISGYSGTAEQNTKLLNLLKAGKLIKE